MFAQNAFRTVWQRRKNKRYCCQQTRFRSETKIAVDKRVLIKIEKHSSSCSEKGKTMRSRISRSLWHRLFFAAIAATTIRAILSFSLRLYECFLYFQNSPLKPATQFQLLVLNLGFTHSHFVQVNCLFFVRRYCSYYKIFEVFLKMHVKQFSYIVPYPKI